MGIYRTPGYVPPADASPAFPASSRSIADRETARLAAQARAERVAAVLGLDPLEALQLRDVSVAAEGELHTDVTIHCRYDRTYAGLPVRFGSVLVHLTRSGEIREALVEPARSIAPASLTPVVSADDAARMAVANTDWREAVRRIPTRRGRGMDPDQYPRSPLVSTSQPTLHIFVPVTRRDTSRGSEDVYEDPALSWRLTIYDGHSIAEEVFIDALTGRPLHQRPTRRA
jgi:hypothetical protein